MSWVYQNLSQAFSIVQMPRSMQLTRSLDTLLSLSGKACSSTMAASLHAQPLHVSASEDCCVHRCNLLAVLRRCSR